MDLFTLKQHIMEVAELGAAVDCEIAKASFGRNDAPSGL